MKQLIHTSNGKAYPESSSQFGINPKVYGAVYDGVTDCSLAIQKALDKGGVIVFNGKGIALCNSSLIIRHNNTHIILSDDFTIKLGYHVNRPLFHTPGSLYKYNDSRVGTEIISHITIEGGTLDFNRAGQVAEKIPFQDQAGVSIVDAVDFNLINVRMKAGIKYYVFCAGLDKFKISGCSFESGYVNSDGIHLHGDVHNGVIENMIASTEDDFIGLNTGGDYYPPQTREWMTREGPGYNIAVRNIECQGCSRLIRILSDDTYKIDAITIDNITGYGIWKGLVGITPWGSDAVYGRINISNIYAYMATNIPTSWSGLGNGSIIFVGNDVGRTFSAYVESIIVSNVNIIMDNNKCGSLLQLTNTATIDRILMSNISINRLNSSGDNISEIKNGNIGLISLNNYTAIGSISKLLDSNIESALLSNIYLESGIIGNATNIEQTNVIIEN